MAKRFTSTDIWEEDWFLDMPSEYKLFWYYILSACNHAGIYKVNVKSFCRLNDLNLTPTKALEYFNNGKQRIRVVSDSVWLIEDFFVYQYGNTLNRGNRVHKSIEVAYNQSDIDLTSIRGLKVVLEGSKRPQNGDNDGVKDKDKDKDKDNRDLEVNTVSKENTLTGLSENIRGTVVYDAEKTLLESPLEMERICMTTGFAEDSAKESLRKYHLFLSEKEEYPKGKKAIFAGFEKWLLNEKKFSNNGTHKQSPNGTAAGKLGTSDARIERAKNW